MPGKPRHRKGRRFPQSARGKPGLGQSATVARQPAVVQTQEPVVQPKATVASASPPAATAKPAAVPYPYVTRELRTIAILAGVMLVILIVVALTLTRHGL